MRSIQDLHPSTDVDGSVDEQRIVEVPFNGPATRVPYPKDHPVPHYSFIVRHQPDKEEVEEWLATYHGYINGFTQDIWGDQTELYDYQVEHMDNMCIFRHIDKSRQVGFSWVFAAEALAMAQLEEFCTCIFISYNQEEANEKILYVNQLEDTIPSNWKKRKVVDSVSSVQFEKDGKRTRIISFASRQPRGKGMNVRIYLDEFAHMMFAKRIYTAAFPAIVRGHGRLTIGSTPMGKGNEHYRIATDRANFDMYSRMRVHWWDCPDLCVNVPEAREKASIMTTEERVNKYATKTLKNLFRGADVDDFRQEFELYYADEALSYYPLDLIKQCVFDSMEAYTVDEHVDPEEFKPAWEKPDEGDDHDTIMEHYAGRIDNWLCKTLNINEQTENAHDRVLELAMAVLKSLKGRSVKLIAGLDVGRNKDTSEISIMQEIEIGNINIHIERLSIELRGVKFREQERICASLLKHMPIEKMAIDRTGIGMNLAENLEEDFPDRVVGIDFNVENKSDMAKNFRFRLEDRTLAINNDDDSIKHIHSIKKTVTDRSNVTYAAEKTARHHGDKFWAKALASIMGNSYDRADAGVANSFRTAGDRLFAGSLTGQQSHGLVVPVSVMPTSTLVNRDHLGGLASMFFDPKFHG